MNNKVYLLPLAIMLGFCSACSVPTRSASRKEAVEKTAAYKTVASLIDMGSYNLDELDSGGSRILIFTRKTGGLSREKIEKAVLLYWPRLTRLLHVKIDEIAVVDFESPLGGGPLGNNVVGIYSSSRINEELQSLVNQATGWPPRSSTKEYVDEHYAGFPDPEQAYINDMVVHELGHTIFGFGKTLAPKEREDWWFCFGLGLVYDRILWEESQPRPSPLFDAAIDQWRNVFAKNAALDQRLIHPDTKRDSEFGLSRFQVYGHGKARVYLATLRQRIGAEDFDKIVSRYVGEERVLTYDDFVKFVPERFNGRIKNLETEFQVR